MRAIRDMNIPKFVAEDIPLFNALFSDLFPAEDIPESSNTTIDEAIRNQFEAEKLQLHENIINKVI
jgi:dynein heavy chain